MESVHVKILIKSPTCIDKIQYLDRNMAPITGLPAGVGRLIEVS